MGKITIVTAFYNIKREEWKGLQRSEETYFSHFEYWARIKNFLVVYVENDEYRKKVEKIREQFELLDQTKVIVTGPIENIDKALFDRMQKVTENPVQINFHFRKENPEAWNTKYNYIMILKGWFIKDAVEKGFAEENIAWLDFGFGRGNVTYVNAEEFSYEWEYDFPKKINIFYKKYPVGKPVFDLVRTGEIYFGGGIFVMDKGFAQEFWQLMRQSMEALLSVGLSDDDQTVLYMAYLKKPELFHIEDTSAGWCIELKIYGGEHLTLAERKAQELKVSVLRKIVRKMRKIKYTKQYINREYHYLREI